MNSILGKFFFLSKRILKYIPINAYILLLFISLFRCSAPFPDLNSGTLFLALLNSSAFTQNSTTSPSDPNLAFKYLFVTINPSNGLLGAGTVTGADSICSAEKNANFASLPGTGADYKALIVSNLAPIRRACNATANCTNIAENSNWILLPNRDYYRGTVASPIKVFTTNSAGIALFPIVSFLDASGANLWWTGLANDWTISVGDTCNNWMDGTGGSTGEFGAGAVTNATAINSGGFSDPCNATKKLVCVRQ
ncbi:hypothetical protein A0128_15130 [Leptospira tipperaryensis]|uniref:DUF1554 domain-containing protein n=1 Tax=Leptospira tipperaryensis TaxID=2564040 RepID=A0A1D7UZR4_9LEPT|nr:hypothetical protein A0128_15130 [Leptospira tipperaryensis]